MRRIAVAGVAAAVIAGVVAGVLALGPSSTPKAASVRATNPSRSILWSVRDEILLVDPVTGGYRTVVRLPDPSWPAAIWAPGHRAVAYQTGRYGNAGWVKLDLSTGKRTRLAIKSETLAWSPDGTKIAYASRSGVTVARASDLKPLFQAKAPPMTAATMIAWAPGPDPVFKGLGFIRNPSGNISADGPEWLYKVDLHTRAVSLVTKVHGPMAPEWTADGSKILFVHYWTGHVAAWTIRPDGTGLTPLPNSSHALAADYSPNGRWIAIVKWVGPPPVHMRLWVMHPNGSGAHPIGPLIPGDYASVDW